MTDTTLDARLRQTFLREQRNGLRLALWGRVAVVVVIGIWIAVSRPPPLLYYMISGVAAFGVLGLLQLAALHWRPDRLWLMYALMLADVAFLVVAIVVFSAPVTAGLPPHIAYRFNLFPYFFLFLAAAAFSYSPALVLWAGVIGGVGWALGAMWVWAQTENPLDWTDIPENATNEEYYAVILSPHFVGTGSCIQEIIVLVVVAALLAVVVWRARRVVYRQAMAEREREVVSETFGKYVPEAVARALIDRQGSLEPEFGTATVLFVDIARFTTMAERMAPAEVVAMLNAYFDAVAEVIGRHGGVINQFQGDAILATFNVPVADPDHAAAAVRTALDIRNTVGGRMFEGQALDCRIGINTGEMIAGSVGSTGRLNYTVHGDAVNVAARLEALNKDYGTGILIAGTTAELAGPLFSFREVGTLPVRGREQPVTLYTVEDEDEQAAATA